MTARSKSAPRFGPGGRSARLKRVLEQVLESDPSSPLCASALQHFGSDEDKFNVIDYFLCDVTLFESLACAEAAVDSPSEAGPAKVTSRAEARPAPSYLRARCVFFKRFLEDKKNDGQDLSYESLCAGLTLGELATRKATEVTMSATSPRAAKSRDLVADFKKGIKRDPPQLPSLKRVDNWPAFKREAVAQARAQGVVDALSPKREPRGSEERELLALQLYCACAIFCSSLKADFGRKLARGHESSQGAQATWAELPSDAEKPAVAQLSATGLLQRVHAARVESWKGAALSLALRCQEQARLRDQLQPPNEQASGHAKMTCLQSAARAAEELRSAQAAGSQLALANGAAPARKGREALLKSAAPTCDRARAPAKRQPTRPAERAGTWGASVTESFKRVAGHEGPFRPSDPECKGSRRNLLFWRESGEAAPEPLSAFGRGDPVSCAARARESGLLGEEGRRQLKSAGGCGNRSGRRASEKFLLMGARVPAV